MIEFLTHNYAPVMFVCLAIFLLIGFPVAFSLAANGLIFALIGIEIGLFPPGLLQALPNRVLGIMANDTLLAIPFFTFMGLILERSGMAEDLLETIGQLFGPVRGGLAYAVIFVGALLAATTGVVAASVISMGLISLPIMLRYGYDRRLASGTIAASGTLAQIIPPSLVLIVLADQMGRSVGDMYEGAILPGLMLAGMYFFWVFLVAQFKPGAAPALPLEARTLRGFKLAKRVAFTLVPPLLLIFLVLGTIFMGIATPTEGGAMGATGALILALINRRLNLKLLRQAMDTTAKLSAFVIFILIGATCFSLTFNGAKGDHWVENLLTQLPGGWLGFLIIINLMVFLLAFFLDFFELAFIIVPLLAPTALKVLSPVAAEYLGITPGMAEKYAMIWFGVLLGVYMQTSFMHPPVGFALFYLRSVAPEKPYFDKVTGKETAPITTGQIYWGAVPYVVIQLIAVTVLIAAPSLVWSGMDKPIAARPDRPISSPSAPRAPGDDDSPGLPKIR
jgi:tripartite ATP-independent transporter DctM subunit